MVGNMLGNRYELIEKIGEGGMAEVYKAKCHILNRYVAIKILKDEFANNKEFVDKFQREARAAGSLSDSHIVNIYDVGNEGNINYIVMEYVKGKTLKQLIKEKGRIDCSETIDIALQIAKALECAHKNNIVHRDIKPHNILINEEGNVKVADFGIARVSDFSTIINTTKIVGSAHYFSPEQARGSIVDCRSDLYSLGIIMYEMVTGKVPYDADTPVSIALKHIQEKVVPPIEINRDIPKCLNNLILKCIEKDPINRYQSAAELMNALNEIKQNKNLCIKPNLDESDYTRIMDPVDIKDFYNDDDDYDDENEDEEYNDDEIKPEISPRKNKIKKRNGKKIAIIFSSIIVAIAIVGIVINIFAGGGKVVVPNIIGMQEDKAKTLIENKGLIFEASVQQSDKPKGEVISCSPTEGTKVKPKSKITVNISDGGQKIKVPDLKNMSLEQAKQKILQNNLTVGNISYEPNYDYEKGTVMDQNPSPDTEINSGDKVDLVVCGARDEGRRITVPSLANLTLDEARNALSSVGLNLGNAVEISTNDKSKDGKILNQSISSGRKVRKNTVINVNYYKYSDQEP